MRRARGFRRMGHRVEERQPQQHIERTKHQQNKACKSDQRAEFLPVPDLIPRIARRAALERLAEPIDGIPDCLGRDVFARMRHGRNVELSRSAIRDGTVEHAGIDILRRSEILFELWRRRHVLGEQCFGRRRRLGEIHRAPHHRRELVIAAEHIGCIVRKAGAARCRRGGRRTDKDQRSVSGRISQRRGKNRRAAKAVALETDIVLVDECEAAQIFQAIRPAPFVRKRRRCAVAVSRHVERKDDIAAARELDGKAVLHLARIDQAVHRQHAGRRRLCGGVGRNIEQGAHLDAAGSRKANVFHAHAIRCLDARGEVRIRPGSAPRPARSETIS